MTGGGRLTAQRRSKPVTLRCAAPLRRWVPVLDLRPARGTLRQFESAGRTKVQIKESRSAFRGAISMTSGIAGMPRSEVIPA